MMFNATFNNTFLYFSYIVAVSFIGRGTQKKPQTYVYMQTCCSNLTQYPGYIPLKYSPKCCYIFGREAVITNLQSWLGIKLGILSTEAMHSNHFTTMLVFG